MLISFAASLAALRMRGHVRRLQEGPRNSPDAESAACEDREMGVAFPLWLRNDGNSTRPFERQLM